MESLGKFLKNERKTRGIALESVAQESKVSVHYLSLLEDGELNKLPASIYAQGYLKAYCDCLGLDKEDVFLRYSHQLSHPNSDERGREKMRASTRHKILVGILLGSIFLAVSIMIYLILNLWR